jgi:hypothetical protein
MKATGNLIQNPSKLINATDQSETGRSLRTASSKPMMTSPQYPHPFSASDFNEQLMRKQTQKSIGKVFSVINGVQHPKFKNISSKMPEESKIWDFVELNLENHDFA